MTKTHKNSFLLPLQGFKEEIDVLQEELDVVQNQGAELLTACGEPDKPVIKKSIDEVSDTKAIFFTCSYFGMSLLFSMPIHGFEIEHLCFFPGEFSLGKSQQGLEGESRETGRGNAGSCAVSGRPAGI